MESEQKIPRAVWTGTFKLWGVDVICHTLDNGARIIEQQSYLALMAAINSGAYAGDDFAAYAAWRDGNLGSA